MQRRSLLKKLVVASVAAPLATVAAGASAKAGAAAARPVPLLDTGRWSAANARRIQSLISSLGNAGAAYNPARRPYVVFDWDNTCIMNDCEEALFMYQIDQLEFKLTPEEFGAVLRKDVPAGPLKTAGADGQRVILDDIAADVDADYSWLHAQRAGGAGLDALRASIQFQDFRAKLYFMYDAICDSHPIEIGYKWVIGFFANMTPAQLQVLAAASNQRGLGDALRKVKYESARSLPGKAGVVAVSHFHGLRVHEEMRSLMHTLRANGFDVFVSTASLDDVVRVFASDPNLAYGVAPENVIGLRLEMSDGKYTSSYRSGWHFNWGPGKTVGIRNVLGARGEPAMVFGDSDGDAWMLQDFKATQVGVIVNRLKTGEIGKLSQKAAAGIGQPNPRFLLQARNENTGIMMPDEQSIKYGKAERKLLA
ncbi:phosphoserine phosphatase [Oxalobacteraceae bacterium GrIS 1.11]